jgi:hypothetical protein
MEVDPNQEGHRTPARGILAANQDAGCLAERRNRRYAPLGIAGLGRIVMRKVDGWKSLAVRPSDRIIDLAA